MTLPALRPGRHTAANRDPARETWARFFRNRSTIAGLLLLAPVLAIALVLPAFYPVDPFEIVWAPLAAPGASPGIPLGSDIVGRDVLAGIVHGGRATHIHVSAKYMDRYLDEFTFRQNHRAKENAMFDLLVGAV